MSSLSISNKILNWYDNNKRDLPWRNPRTIKQSQYYTLVSEIMLQQTQVKTALPYFNKFVKEIPNIEELSNIKQKKLFKLWEGLGYYSRAINLKKTAKLIKKNFNNKLPKSMDELKKLPGIGEYTSRAILALEYNKKVIPLDGNIERLIKRVLFLKKEKDIKKDSLMNKLSYFGNSDRQRDYVQALMELGALICRPTEPTCVNCPITKNCKSFKNKNFELVKILKKNKIKFFKVNVYIYNHKMLLVKNNKFNFLKNHFIFPMHEIEEKKYKLSTNKKIQIKMSNLNMRIIININNKKTKIRGRWFNQKNIHNTMMPSFTKKILRIALS